MLQGVWSRTGTGAAFLAIFTAAGCGGDATARSGEWAGTIDTLANGAVMVSNPEQGLWSPEERWTLVEELRIGSMEVDGPDLFGNIAGVEADALGRIYVADSQANEIRVFDADGRHVRSFGRKGGGPGEFEQIAGMGWGPDGHLWIMDARNSRFAVFDTTGTYITAHRRPGGFIMIPWPGGFDRDGHLYDMNLVSSEGGDFQRGMLRYDSEMEARDTFRLPEFEGTNFTLTGDDGRRIMTSNVPFTPTQSWTLTRNGDFWMGISDRFRLHRVDFSGDTVQVVEKPFTPAPVTSEEREEAIEGLKWFTDQGGKVDASRIPSTKPAFGGMFTDDEDHLWVSGPRTQNQPASYHVFDPDGRYLGEVESGVMVGYMRPVVRDGMMYAVVRDELEVPYVVRLRIEGRAGA